MLSYGLDFGTTNTSISILKDGKPYLFPVDEVAPSPDVIRSALYFFPRKFVVHTNVPKEAIQAQTFKADQFHYEGEIKTIIGNRAVQAYLDDNKSRHSGIKRKIFTGKIIPNIILWTNPYSGRVYTADVPEYYEEIDYGTGRLFHALKSALKSPLFKGNRVFGNYYELEQLIGLLLSQIKRRADEISGEKIDSVVCGRPRYFSTDPHKDQAAEDRLRAALNQAGFKDIKFEFEPVAAAKYYLSRFPQRKQKVFVFDFGGGTLDTTIIEQTDKGYHVIATDGVYIGGDLLNSDIFYHKLGPLFGTKLTWGDRQMPMPNHIIDDLRSWYGIPNLNNQRDIEFLTGDIRYQNSDLPAVDRLLHLIRKNLGFEVYEAIEKAKKDLTYQDRSKIEFKDGPIDIGLEISKTEFEELISPRIEEVKKTVLRTLEYANLEPEQIDIVVRTGGSSLIPVFEQMLVKIFGGGRVTEFDPFTSVVAGLSIR
ncbi:MAG: Hsp70 family protein [Patescibacteria group bacterium]